MLVNSLKEITLDTFKNAVYQAVTNKITSVAPLGYSSPTILLYGNNGNERRSGVSVRNHSGNLSMLICDARGSFIFHGGFDKTLPIDFITSELYKTFKRVKKHITKELPRTNELDTNLSANYTKSGFELLAAAQRGLFFV